MMWTTGTDEYEEARLGFQRLDPHRPERVCAVTGTDEVQEAVRFAATKGLGIAVQATGHGVVEGIDGGVLISTRRLDEVRIDPDRRTAWIGAGATWRTVIDAAAEYGLAPLSGSSSGVGAISYTLGGGLGLLARRYGYAADRVRGVELVTADGELRRAEDEPELFWAVRGGGGNFGVVTGIEIDLVEVSRLYGGLLTFDLARYPDAPLTWLEWTRTLPEQVTSGATLAVMPDIPQLPEALRGKYVGMFHVAALEGADEVVEPLRAIGEPLRDSLGELAYTESDRIFDEPVQPGSYRSHSVVLADLDPAALVRVRDLAVDRPSVVGIRQLGGALGRMPDPPNAVGHRDAAYAVTAISFPPDRTPGRIVEPLSEATIGRMPNFSYSPFDVAEAYDPGDYERLRRVRAQYDPDELLRPNHPIR